MSVRDNLSFAALDVFSAPGGIVDRSPSGRRSRK